MVEILYWIGTPRHFLISAGMAFGSERESDLLLTSNYDYVKGIRAILGEWTQSPFARFRSVQTPLRTNSLSRRLQIIKDNSHYRKFARTHSFSEVRAFAATTYATQTFLYEIKQNLPGVRCVMVEDGGIFYNEQPLYGDAADENYSKLKLLAGRVLYGQAWRAVKANGIGEVIDEIHLISPELVREEWASLNLVKLPPSCLLQLSDSDLPDIYIRTASSSIEELRQIELAIILSRSDGVVGDLGEYVRTVNNLLAYARKSGLRTAVKYHPKEQEPDYLMLTDKPWVTEIPKQIPIELLFVVNPTNLKFVLGDTSTALLSVPWLLPECKAISFVHMVSKQPDLIYPDFGGFGIELIRDMHDFSEILIGS